MIDWIYSDPHRIGSATVVTRGRQNFWEGAKTIVGSSNRFRVVTDVGYDDFMHSLRLLGAEQAPSRLAAPPRVPWKVIEQRGVSSDTYVAPGTESGAWNQKPVRTARS